VLAYFRKMQMPWSVSLMAIASLFSLAGWGCIHQKIRDNNREIEYFPGVNRIDGESLPFLWEYILIDITKQALTLKQLWIHFLKKSDDQDREGYKDRKFIRIRTGKEKCLLCGISEANSSKQEQTMRTSFEKGWTNHGT
jgi:hypothetical protein